ncbi:hypothetical protein Dimus_037393 [Dionaea muscipula]
MSKHFTLDIAEMKDRAKTKIGKSWEKVFPKPIDPPVAISKVNTKRKRGKETLSVDKGISLSFSKEASLYSDPGSLLDSFDDLLFLNDIKHFEELGTTGVNDHLLQDALKAENKTFRTAEKKLKDELRRMKEEVEQSKLECEKYKSEHDELLEEIKDVVSEAVVKTRGILMKEFKEQRTGEWDIDGDVALMDELYLSSTIEAELVKDPTDDQLEENPDAVKSPLRSEE